MTPRDDGETPSAALDRLVRATTRPIDNEQRLDRRAIGCLLSAVVLAVMLVAGWLVSVALLTSGPPRADEMRPLPPDVVVVEEQAECPGNGDGWHACERRIRLRREGTDGETLRKEVLAHYLSPSVPVTADTRPHPCGGVAEVTADEELREYVCIQVQQATGRGLSRSWAPPGPDDVDVVATTYAYFN